MSASYKSSITRLYKANLISTDVRNFLYNKSDTKVVYEYKTLTATFTNALGYVCAIVLHSNTIQICIYDYGKFTAIRMNSDYEPAIDNLNKCYDLLQSTAAFDDYLTNWYLDKPARFTLDN